MPLVDLPLLGGQSNDTEPTVATKPTVMENCWYQKVSGVQRRFGITKQTTGTNLYGSSVYIDAGNSIYSYSTKPYVAEYGSDTSGGSWSLGSPLNLVTKDNSALVCYTGGMIRTYVPGRSAWANQDIYTPISATVESGCEGYVGSIAVANNRIAQVFVQSVLNTSGNTVARVYGRVLDATTKEAIVDRTLLYTKTSPTDIIQARVTRLGSNFLFVYPEMDSSSALIRREYNTTTDSFGSAVTYSTWTDVQEFEIDSDRSSYTQYAILATDASDTKLIVYNSSHAAGTTLVVNATNHYGLSMYFYNGGIWAAGQETTSTTLRLWRIESATPSVLDTATRTATTSSGVRTTVMGLDPAQVGGSTPYVLFAYEDPTSNGQHRIVWEYAVYSAGAISNVRGPYVRYNARLRSYPITIQMNSNYQIFMAVDNYGTDECTPSGGSLVWFYDNPFQLSTATTEPPILANFYAPNERSGYYSSYAPSRCEIVDSTNFAISSSDVIDENLPLLALTAADDTSGTVRVVTFTEDTSVGVQTAGAISPLGAVRNFDGANAVDFNIYLTPVISTTVTAGGSLSIGSYSVAVIVKHKTDNQLIQSVPAVATVTTTSGNVSFTLSIENITLSDCDTDSNPLIFEVYLTELNSDIYYFKTSVINDRNSANQSITIGTGPVTTNRQLYTAGDTLDNSPPPGGTCATIHQNRLFVGGTPDDSIFYTKEFVFGELPGFNEGLKFQPFEGGRTVALASLDTALVVFKQTGIYAISGQGPNDKGEDSSYSNPQKVQADTGCVDRKSVVSTPLGIFFRGRRGLYLLDRSLSVKYVGRAIEDVLTSSVTVTDSVYYEKDSQVWFFTNSNSVYVYDLLNDAWSVFKFKKSGGSDLNPRVGCVLSGELYMVDTGLNLWKYDRTKYLDEDYYFTDKYRSQFSSSALAATLGIAGVQQWTRVRNVLVKGTVIENSGATVTLYYNGDTATSSSRAWTAAEASATGDTYNRQYRIVPGLQKCESIAVEYISTTPTSPSTGGGIRLQSITLEIEAYRRPTKRRANAQK